MVENLDRDNQLASGRINSVIPTSFTGWRYGIPINTETTIWQGPVSAYTFTDETVNTITHISSSNAGDTSVTIAISGIDSNWALSNQTIALNGQNKTALTYPLIRVNAARALQQPLGTIYIYEDDTVTNGVPDTNTKIKGYIDPNNNIMSAAIYTVPDNYNAQLLAYYAQISPPATGCAYLALYAKEYGLTRIRSAYLPFCAGASTISNFRVPLPFNFTPKTDLIATLFCGTPNSGAFFNASLVLRHVQSS